MQQNRRVKPEDMIFLTNQGCEDTGQVDEARLVAMGLSYGEFEGDTYPLTEQASQFIIFARETPSFMAGRDSASA